MIHTSIENHKEQIIDEVRALFLDKYDDALRYSTNPQEPDYVLHLINDLPARLEHILQYYLASYKLSFQISSVFCHQSPYVGIDGTTDRCELGDLLICHIFHPKNGMVQRRALLLQAKMTDSFDASLSTKDVQLRLYTEWPAFRYYRGGNRLTGQVRDPYPKQIRNGAQYLLIRKKAMSPFYWPRSLGVGHSPFSISIPHSTLRSYSSMEESIIGLLGLNRGSSFDEFATSNDDWSKIIWDLLINGFNKIFTRRRSGLPSQSRLMGDRLDPTKLDGLFYVSDDKIHGSSILMNSEINPSNVTELSSILPPPTDNDAVDEKGGNPSIILIETFEQ